MIKLRNIVSLNANSRCYSNHVPVMPNEVLRYLGTPKFENSVIVDCTFGGGGHTSSLLKQNSNCTIYAIDRDKSVFKLNEELIEAYPQRLIPIHGKYSDIETLLKPFNVSKVDGILMDIGVSSMQIDRTERGFSYKHDAPLDMRMDNTSKLTAYDVINKYSVKELSQIFWQYGEDIFSARIAYAIGNARKEPIKTTLQLAKIIESVRPKGKSKYLQNQDPSRKIFQALRVFVNSELEELALALRATERMLNPEGRLLIISFQPFEDKIIKEYLFSCCIPKSKRDYHISDTDIIPKEKEILKKPSFRFVSQLDQPSDLEIISNPRSRSAKLRCVERTTSSPMDFPINSNTWMVNWDLVAHQEK